MNVHAIHFQLPPHDPRLGQVRSVCGGVWGKNTHDPAKVTCTVCLQRMVERVERELMRAPPVHCPRCAAERGVAIPKHCPHQ